MTNQEAIRLNIRHPGIYFKSGPGPSWPVYIGEMKLLLLSLVLITLSFNSFAQNDYCLCETGNSPKLEVPLYRAGCKLWLASEACDGKKVISIDDDLDLAIPRSFDGKKVKLGYVGHWSSTGESAEFIMKRILPLNQSRGISFFIHNTACYSTDRTLNLQTFMNVLDVAPGTVITFQGNQTASVGMWEKFIPFKENMYSIVSTNLSKPIFPACIEFEGKRCLGRIQLNEVGICSTIENGKNVNKILACEEVKAKVSRINPRKDGGMIQQEVTTTKWLMKN